MRRRVGENSRTACCEDVNKNDRINYFVELIVISCSDTTDVAIETPKNRQLGKLLYSNYYGGYRLKALIVLTFEGYVYSGDLFSGDN